MPRSKTLRILCFGDSLTQGWFHYGLGQHPYSIQLEKRLREVLPAGTTLEVRTSGMAGDVVAFPRFRERFDMQGTWGYMPKRYSSALNAKSGTDHR